MREFKKYEGGECLECTSEKTVGCLAPWVCKHDKVNHGPPTEEARKWREENQQKFNELLTTGKQWQIAKN